MSIIGRLIRKRFCLFAHFWFLSQYIDLAEAKGEAPVNEKHCNKEIQLELSLRSVEN